MATFMPRDSNLKVEMFLLFPGFLSLFFACGLLPVHEVILGLQEEADASSCQGRVLAIPLVLLCSSCSMATGCFKSANSFAARIGILEPVA